MPGKEDGPKDPRKGRRPKDSEFYQIPPDLKKEFDMIMTGRSPSGPAVEDIEQTLLARKKLAILSLVFGVLGGVLIGIGPVLAVVLGMMARRKGKGMEGVPPAGLEAAKFGILLGIVMFLVNIGLLIFLVSR